MGERQVLLIMDTKITDILKHQRGATIMMGYKCSKEYTCSPMDGIADKLDGQC